MWFDDFCSPWLLVTKSSWLFETEFTEYLMIWWRKMGVWPHFQTHFFQPERRQNSGRWIGGCSCWAQCIGSIVVVSSWLSHYKAGMSSSWFLYLEFMVHIFAVGGIYDFKQIEVCWSRQFARFEFVCLLSRCASAFVIATLLLSKRVSIPALSVDFRLENSQECFM